MKKLSLEEVNQKLKNNDIDYVCVEFNGYGNISQFYCEEHDHYFPADLTNVIKKKSWCLWESNWKQTSWTKDSFNDELKLRNVPHTLIGNYINLRTETDFLCDKNHTFQESPSTILKGKCKCPYCYDEEYKINEFNNKLNDKGITYKLISDYINNTTLSKFYCDNHGEFDAVPANIVAGHKCCIQCQHENGRVLKHSKYSFNKKLESKNIPYVLVDDDFTVKTRHDFYCKECGGYFDAIPDNIVNNRSGCPHCRSLDILYSFLTDIEENNIPYKLVGVYTNSKTETTFYCEEHNNCFEAVPNGLIKGKDKCPMCHVKTYWNLEMLNEYLKENNRNLIFHEFTRVDENSKCECVLCGHIWNPTPSSIIHSKSNCPCCTKHTFNVNGPALLYYIKFTINDITYYKLGITSRTLPKRFMGEGIKWEIVFIINFDLGKDAKSKESELLKMYKEWNYTGPKLLKKTGNREIFIKDVFNGNYDF